MNAASVATSNFVELTLDTVALSMVTMTFSMDSSIAQSVVIVPTEALFLRPHFIYVQLSHLLLLKLEIVHELLPIFAVQDSVYAPSLLFALFSSGNVKV